MNSLFMGISKATMILEEGCQMLNKHFKAKCADADFSLFQQQHHQEVKGKTRTLLLYETIIHNVWEVKSISQIILKSSIYPSTILSLTLFYCFIFTSRWEMCGIINTDIPIVKDITPHITFSHWVVFT